MDRDLAKELANKITATGKAVGFPANLKVYTGGKAPGVEKWLVYARIFEAQAVNEGGWEYLSNQAEVDVFLADLT